MAFGSPCIVYRNSVKNLLAHNAHIGLIDGKSEEIKGYNVWLKKRKVVATQYIKTIGTLDATQNKQVKKRFFINKKSEAAGAENAARILKSKSKEKTWQKEWHGTINVTKRKSSESHENIENVAHRNTTDTTEDNGTVNFVLEVDPKNYNQAMKSKSSDEWKVAINENITALDRNDVWKVIKWPEKCRPLHMKWVFKTKLDENGDIERYPD